MNWILLKTKTFLGLNKVVMFISLLFFVSNATFHKKTQERQISTNLWSRWSYKGPAGRWRRWWRTWLWRQCWRLLQLRKVIEMNRKFTGWGWEPRRPSKPKGKQSCMFFCRMGILVFGFWSARIVYCSYCSVKLSYLCWTLLKKWNQTSMDEVLPPWRKTIDDDFGGFCGCFFFFFVDSRVSRSFIL